MDDSLVVTIAGLQMFGRPGLGPFGIIKDGLKGWDDGVDMIGGVVKIPSGPGSYAISKSPDSRVVSIDGLIMSKSEVESENAKNRLTGLLRNGLLGRITVQKAAGTQWANCFLVRAAAPRRHGTFNRDFDLQLWCPDPRKFGELRTFVASAGTSVTVFHRGNYDAVPRFVVAGSMPGGYVLTIRGVVFNVTQPLVAGQPHSIDYGDGRLRIGGAVVHGGIGWGFTPSIPPGNVTVLAIAPRTTGTATATLTLLDTYI